MSYTHSAHVYDKIYRFKNYLQEARAIQEYAARFQSTPAHRLLDVGCGTGGHLVYLREWYECVGIDYSPEMLAVARKKLPDLPLHQGDMRTFDLVQQFDLVICLYSAIGYMTTPADLQQAVNTMARHVAPGGLLMFDGWFAPDQFDPNRIGILAIDEPNFKLARTYRNQKNGTLSIMEMHHLVNTPERADYFVERHEMGLYTPDEYVAALQSAGLRAEVDPIGPAERGFYIGIKES